MSSVCGPDDEVHRLLLDLGWLRALARRLAGDAHLADDLVQEACTIALRQQTAPRQWRAWMTGVLKTLVRSHRRSRGRQQRLLQQVGSEVAGEDAATLVQRAEVHQQLVQALLGLEDPYRSTLLLRFFEALPPRRIAERQGVPVATVNSRLQRGLQMLRERLDREAGGRSRWLAALAPFAWPGRSVAGAVGVRSSRLLGAIAVCVVTAGLAVLWVTRPGGEVVTVAAGDGQAPRSEGGMGVAATAGATAERVAPAPDVPEAPAKPTFAVRGRVLDCSGAGVAGVAVTAVLGRSAAEASAKREIRDGFATTGADGSFAGELPERDGLLMVLDPTRETVLVASWSHGMGFEPVIVVAPSVRLCGILVERSGLPACDGKVRLQLPDDLLTRLAIRVDASHSIDHDVPVLAGGRFGARLPFVDGAVLRCTAAGCRPTTLAMPSASTSDLRITLEPVVAAEADVQGRVLAPDGSPVAGARVVMGEVLASTDRDGRFVLAGSRVGAATGVTAALPGFLPAMCEVPTDPVARRAGIVLQLGSVCGEVTGRVVDESGPVAGAEVWIDDPTPFGGLVAGRVVQLEYFTGGAPLRSRSWDGTVPLGEANVPRERGGNSSTLAHEEESTASWAFVTTDAQGRFTVPGLQPRAYRLRAFERTTGRFGVVGEVIAGSRPEIVLPARAEAASLRGRVVSPHGHPIEGAVVQHKHAVWQQATKLGKGSHTFVVLRDGNAATSAVDGTFVLDAARSENGFLMVEGDKVVPTRLDLAAPTADPARLVVPRRCVLEVVLADPDEADAVVFVDAERRKQRVGSALLENTKELAFEVPLHGGRSGALVVGDAAAKCVLFRGKKFVREVPIAPDPGRATLVQ